MQTLPVHLNEIAMCVVETTNDKLPLPKILRELVNWYENEGWDLLVGAWSDERIILKLYELAEFKFNDSELIAYEDPTEAITDDSRLAYAWRRISEEFESGDGSTCPSVHTVEIRHTNGRSAILGWLVEIHGQEGHYAYFCGVYQSRDDFYEQLRNEDHLFQEDDKVLNDSRILKLWKN